MDEQIASSICVWKGPQPIVFGTKRYSAVTSGHKLKIIQEVLRIVANNNYFSAT
ncbi:MAG: hypothetical protein H8D47_00450 [Planctomycetes bacterium]|nr:hypothetical protein [Planctomycetota bacterium]